MAIATAQRTDERTIPGFGARLPFEAIEVPGCYVCNWSGHLLRVPEGAVSPFHAPFLSMNSRGRLFVTRISNNPYETVAQARGLAETCKAPVNF